jgi:ribosomal protein S27E
MPNTKVRTRVGHHIEGITPPQPEDFTFVRVRCFNCGDWQQGIFNRHTDGRAAIQCARCGFGIAEDEA